MAADAPHWEDLIKGSTFINLPSDIVIDILLRLPVVSLVRFRCVCKAWLTLFCDPKFIKMHVETAIMKNNSCLLLKHVSNSDQIYSLRDSRTFDEIARLDVPLWSKTRYFEIVGSCHGLICLVESNFGSSLFSLNAYLWNAAIEEFKVFPGYHIDRIINPHSVVGLGFAFHSGINDYKFVRFVYFFIKKVCEVQVYSLAVDSWRKISNSNFQGNMHNSVSQACVNGALHWIISKIVEKHNVQDSILSFDIGEDKLNEIMLPKFGYSIGAQKILSVLKESLCLLIYNPFNLNESGDIWVMREHGVVDSWTKIYRLTHEVEFLMPRGFSSNDQIIMEDCHEELVLYDINVKQRRNLHVFGPARVVKYTESLVFPGGRGRIVEALKWFSTR